MLVAALLRSMIRTGSLRLIDAAGRSHQIGEAGPPQATVRLKSARVEFALTINPALSLGEAYMDGTMVIEQGGLYDAMEPIVANYKNVEEYKWFRLLERFRRRLKQYNSIANSQHNVAHHYDLSAELYEIFLDRDWQYSCAYFKNPSDCLDTAQENKRKHIASKLLLSKPGLKLLDIGSGWGGLAIHLAETADADVTGITLSREQHSLSEARAAQAGLAGRVRFHLRDYREEFGVYDRIVSVGMFEHVGKRNYTAFFAKLQALLVEDGVALLHSIGFSDSPAPINPFIRKYIFPGADLPSLSEVFSVVERSGLIVTDVEILRLHYAETLRHWRERLVARKDEVIRLYDERFYRMWEFYFVLCELGFRYRSSIVFQMQLTKRFDTAPLTRDYMLA